MGNNKLHRLPWIIAVKHIGFKVSFGASRRHLWISVVCAPWLLDNLVTHMSHFKDSGFQDT